jgi:hypothetical protein
VAQRFGERDAVHHWHQPVRDYERIPLLLDELQRCLAIGSARDFEPCGREPLGHQLQLELVVVDQ